MLLPTISASVCPRKCLALPAFALPACHAFTGYDLAGFHGRSFCLETIAEKNNILELSPNLKNVSIYFNGI